MKLIKILPATLTIAVFILVASFTLPAKATVELNILNDTGYLDDYGWYHVPGEVENVGDQAVKYVRIKVFFYNASDDLLCTKDRRTELDTINPDRKSPFEVTLSNEVLASEVDHYSLTVLSYDVTSAKPIGLKILTNNSYIDEWGDMIINGTIKNIGTETAENLKVIATYYDADGNVMAVEYSYTDPINIEPGLVFPFEIELYEDERIPYITSYELTAESSQYAIVPEFSLIILLPLLITFSLVGVVLAKKTKPREKVTIRNV